MGEKIYKYDDITERARQTREQEEKRKEKLTLDQVSSEYSRLSWYRRSVEEQLEEWNQGRYVKNHYVWSNQRHKSLGDAIRDGINYVVGPMTYDPKKSQQEIESLRDRMSYLENEYPEYFKK